MINLLICCLIINKCRLQYTIWKISIWKTAMELILWNEICIQHCLPLKPKLYPTNGIDKYNGMWYC